MTILGELQENYIRTLKCEAESSISQLPSDMHDNNLQLNSLSYPKTTLKTATENLHSLISTPKTRKPLRKVRDINKEGLKRFGKITGDSIQHVASILNIADSNRLREI